MSKRFQLRRWCWLRMKIFLRHCGEPFQVYLRAVPKSTLTLTYTWDIVSSKARGIRRVNLIWLKQISHPSSSSYLLKWTDFGRPRKKNEIPTIIYQWACCNCVSEVPIYLSGAGEENVTVCIKVCLKDCSDDVDSLRNTHEETDDRMMFHVHQSVTTENFESVIIASGDTDVFVCSIYHFNRWIYRGLKEIWIVSGKSGSTTVFPIHQLAEQLESNVADILPAIHVLTGLLFTIEQNSSFNSLFSRILKLFFHSEIWF